MKNYVQKALIPTSLIILTLFSLIGASPKPYTIFNKKQNVIVMDNDSKQPLPDRFRDVPSLNISGSSQFNKNQIEPLKKAINKEKICIVDLRQESHGLVNDYAISFYNFYKLLNNGFSTTETIEKENSELDRIKLGSDISIYRKSGKLAYCPTVDFVSNDEEAVTAAGMQSKRFAVKNGDVPTLDVLEEFVDFVKNKPEDLHLHFHCDAGIGRTTLFMIFYQIMNNPNNLTLEQIETYQYNIGSIIPHKDPYKEEFTEQFYNYVAENKSTNYETSYTEWLCKVNNNQ